MYRVPGCEDQNTAVASRVMFENSNLTENVVIIQIKSCLSDLFFFFSGLFSDLICDKGHIFPQPLTYPMMTWSQISFLQFFLWRSRGNSDWWFTFPGQGSSGGQVTHSFYTKFFLYKKGHKWNRKMKERARKKVYLARTVSLYILLFTCNIPNFYNFTILVHEDPTSIMTNRSYNWR